MTGRTGQAGEPPATPTEALQKALAAEHAATWLYGFLGARVSASAEPRLAARLTDAFEQHRAARDDLGALLVAAGATPVASQAEYAAPGPAGTPDEVRAVARTIEERVTRTYAEVVGTTAGDDRRRAISGLRAAAVRSLGFGSAPTDLPGQA